MKTLIVLLLALAAGTAHAQTPKLLAPVGVTYSSVGYTETQGDLDRSFFGPRPDVTGTFSVIGLSGGIFYVSESGLGGTGSMEFGRIAQNNIRFDAKDPRWSWNSTVNGLYAFNDYFLVTAGFHTGTMYSATLRTSYVGLGLQGGVGVTFGPLLLQAERLWDSGGFFDVFDLGHVSQKVSRFSLSYLISLNSGSERP
jgi:hypothetical protein